ncbi:hypothetical protein ZWY2020_025997 [Hordeum vulgare]|nr:hypothetical protein ZWY2020_025997 [Hordeum vulgare]
MLNWGRKAVLNARVPVGKLVDRSAVFSSGSRLFVGVKVICHPVTGRTKGYGFVRFSLEKEVAATLEKMSDAVLDGRTYGCISQTVDDLLLETGFRPAL